MIKRWETQTYLEIKAQACSASATVYFAGESDMQSYYHTGTSWAPVGETPAVTMTGRRFSLNIISAVSPRGDVRFIVHNGSVILSIYKEFLERLMIGATRPVLVIVDGHPTHKPRLVQVHVDGLDGRCKLFLPAALFAAFKAGQTGIGSRQASRQQAIYLGKRRHDEIRNQRATLHLETAEVG